MKIADYIEFLVSGEVQQLAVSDVGDLDPASVVTPTDIHEKNRKKLTTYLNLANIELYKKFNISVKTLELDFALAGEEFSIPDDYLHAINGEFKDDGEDIPLNNNTKDVVDEVDSLVSIILVDPTKVLIKGTDAKGRKDMLLKYASAPKLAKNIRSKLELPHTYTEALLNYAAYKAHVSVSGDMKAENNTYYLRFKNRC